MKTKVLKFVRKNLYQYNGIWLVKNGVWRPLYAMMLCEVLNHRNLLIYEKSKYKTITK